MVSTIKDSVASASGTSDLHNIFPFFELPRELRDMVYDEGLDDHEMTLKCGMMLRAMAVANTNFLLVNRQFQEEYQQRVRKTAALTFQDRDRFHFETFNLPAGATRVIFIELNIAAIVSHNLTAFQGDPVTHNRWVAKMLQQQQNLRELSININVDFFSPGFTPEHMRDQLNSCFWTTPTQLSALHVHDIHRRKGRQHQKDHFNFSYQDKVVLKWSSATRKVELVERELYRPIAGEVTAKERAGRGGAAADRCSRSFGLISQRSLE